MRTPVFCVIVMAQAALLLIPSASAAAQVGLETLQILNEDGEPVRFAGEGKAVKFVLTLNNKGDEAFNGPVTIVFRVNTTTSGYDQSFTLTNTVSISAGGTSNVTHEWTPAQKGAHVLSAYNAADPGRILTLPFEVQETEVLRGSMVDRVVQYGWLYAMLFGLLVLFVAVVRLRKPHY